MSESLKVDRFLSKREKYRDLLPQLRALCEGEKDVVARLANIAAALKETFGFFWIGFYLVRSGELVLGPFQGPVACTRIQKGKGVCGTAWEKMQTMVVPDVDEFPGHIACSSSSRSEVVVPVIRNGEVIMVLDADSDQLNDFNEEDVSGLQKIADLISAWDD